MGERRRSWSSSDLCVDLSHYPAECVLESHSHTNAFFCFMLNGICEERANGLHESFRPGSLIYHAKGCEHTNCWHEAGRCLHIEFSPGFYEGLNPSYLSRPVPQIIAGRACSTVRS